MRKKKILQYEPYSPEFAHLGTTQSIVPQWYKDAPRYLGGELKVYPHNTKAVKTCMVFFDAMTAGYYIPLPADVKVTNNDGMGFRMEWMIESASLGTTRNPGYSEHVPVPAGHHPETWVWHVQTAWKLPEGYSAILAHPFNRFDLPFTTLTGIVDGGWEMYRGSVPFHFKEGFEGVIKKGTPILQVIPFKNEAWKAELTPGIAAEAEKNVHKQRTWLEGWYKHNIWQRKSYE
jgi:hypothetical protein